MTDSPLLVPELLTLIAECLNKSEAVAPSLVGRTWYYVFCRIIWRYINMTFMDRDRSQYGLARNADLARGLLLLRPSLDEASFSLSFSRLTRVSLCLLPTAAEAGLWNLLADIVLRNDHLQKIVAHADSHMLAPRMFWSALTCRLYLREVEVCKLYPGATAVCSPMASLQRGAQTETHEHPHPYSTGYLAGQSRDAS